MMYNLVTSWDICNLIEIFKLKIFKEERMSSTFKSIQEVTCARYKQYILDPYRTQTVENNLICINKCNRIYIKLSIKTTKKYYLWRLK